MYFEFRFDSIKSVGMLSPSFGYIYFNFSRKRIRYKILVYWKISNHSNQSRSFKHLIMNSSKSRIADGLAKFFNFSQKETALKRNLKL